MKLTEHMAKHLRDVHFGGNWTDVSLEQKLDGVTWEEATTRVGSFHTIATLVFHVNYYVRALSKVLRGGPLDSHDRYSFAAPPLHSREDWERLLESTWSEAEDLAVMIAELPESRLSETFVEEKYGTYYRNIHGLIEHTHYHLGQIAMLRKMIAEGVHLDAGAETGSRASAVG